MINESAPAGSGNGLLGSSTTGPVGCGYDYGRRGERKAAPAHQKRKARRYPVRPPPTIHNGGTMKLPKLNEGEVNAGLCIVDAAPSETEYAAEFKEDKP